MITVNSISGGKSSGYLAVKYPSDYNVFSLVCIDDLSCAPKDRSIVQYVNAKLDKFIPEYGEFIATAEDDQTLYAMRDLEQFIGKEIIWVRGKSFDSLLDEPSYFGGKPTRLPSWARRYCTLELKLLPIFYWWFYNIGERCRMNIGFRLDEFDRMEGFFNNSPKGFKIPVSCSTRGKRLQRHEVFDWRFCSFPLIRDGIVTQIVEDFWRTKGVIPANLFEPARKIVFPKVSNCIHCFHKKPETLAYEATVNRSKMLWAAGKENKGMGTWLDSKILYASIIEHASRQPYLIEQLTESGAACGSGGCHD